jgi:mannose-6-phosphate isomerase-like protein (cupin superfamily)
MNTLFARRKFKSPVDRSAVAHDWQARGFSCEIFVDPPGREWLDFVHGKNELVTVIEGCLHLTVGDQIFVAEVGDEVFIPRGVQHFVRNIHDRTTRWLYGYD